MANSSMIKDRKYMPPIQEIAIVDNQATYPINSSSIEGLEFLSRKPNEKFYIMVKDADYTLEQVSGVWNITIINTDLLEAITDIQVASALTIESGEYDPIGSVDIVTLKDYYNKLYRDFINLQSFYNINSFLTDGLTDNLVLPSLKPNETWVMNADGEVITTPIGIINDSVEKLLEDLKKELDDFTEEQKVELDIFTEEQKVELDIFTEEQKVELDIFTEEQKVELNNFTEEQKNEVIIVADAKIEEINNIILDNAGNGLVKFGNTINVGTANDGITVNADNIQLNTINNLTSTSTTQPLSSNQGKVLQDGKLDKTSIKTEQLTNTDTDILSSSASNKLFENGVGADVFGYIEDGGTHTAGTVWLSKYNKGEFKCLTTNTDDFIDTNKWEQIDDLTNASKLQNLSNFTTTPLVKKNINISDVSNQIVKTGRIVSLFLEFTVSENISVNQLYTPLFELPDYILPATTTPPRGFLMPIVSYNITGTQKTIYEIFINKTNKEISLSGHIGTRDLNLIPDVYYQLNCTWTTS